MPVIRGRDGTSVPHPHVPPDRTAPGPSVTSGVRFCPPEGPLSSLPHKSVIVETAPSLERLKTGRGEQVSRSKVVVSGHETCDARAGLVDAEARANRANR